MSKQGEVIDLKKGKTTYKAQWSNVDGELMAIPLTPSEYKAAAARGVKMESLMPAFIPNAVNTGAGPYITGEELGMKPDWNPNIGAHNWTDNAAIIQKYIDDMPAGTYARIRIDTPGQYYFNKAISVKGGKGLDIRGPLQMPYNYQPTAAASFIYGQWRTPMNGFEFAGDALASHISDLRLYGNIAEDELYSGIYHENIMHIERVWVDSFAYGFYTRAAVEAGGNSSLSYYQSCRASNNKRSGFHASGPDANAINYMNCVSVQNWIAGFEDNSLLGNYYFGCQTATNGSKGSEAFPATVGGGWVIPSATAQTAIIACYSEQGDQLPNYIHPNNGAATVVGGIHASGWTGALPGELYRAPGGNIMEGISQTNVQAKKLGAGELSMGDILLSPTQGYKEATRLSFRSGNLNYLEMVSPGVPHQLLGKAASHQPQGRRSAVGVSLAIPSTVWEGEYLKVSGKTDMEGQVFFVGDKIENHPYDPNGPEYWRCTKAGRNASEQAFEIATMGNFMGDQFLQSATLANPELYGKLVVGDHLVFENGAIGRVQSVDTEYLVSISHPPGIHVHEGDRIDFFGGWINPMQPVGYTDTTMVLKYTPETKVYEVGEAEIVDGKPTTVKAVRFEGGVQLVEFNFPEGAEPDWFTDHPRTNIGLGAANVTRKPWSFDHTDPAKPTVTVAFPMADLSLHADIQVNGLRVKVVGVKHPGITIVPVNEFSVWQNQSGSFTIQKPEFKAY